MKRFSIAALLLLAPMLTQVSSANASESYPAPTISFSGEAPEPATIIHQTDQIPEVIVTSSDASDPAGATADCQVTPNTTYSTQPYDSGANNRAVDSLYLSEGVGTYSVSCLATPATYQGETGPTSSMTEVFDVVNAPGTAPVAPTSQSSGQVSPGVPSLANGYSTVSSSSATITPQYSTNWSGYVATPYGSSSFSGAEGTFNVPHVNASQSLGSDGLPPNTAVWVGLDGWYSDDYLLQAGLNISPFLAPELWYVDQDYPGPVTQSAYQATPINMNISYGDQITVNIWRSSSTDWTISMEDDTSGSTWSGIFPFGGSARSAEWVTEDPGDGNNLFDFAQFTDPVEWTNVATQGPANDSNLSAMTLEASGESMTTLTGLENGSFGDSYSPGPLSAGLTPIVEDPSATPPVVSAPTPTLPSSTSVAKNAATKIALLKLTATRACITNVVSGRKTTKCLANRHGGNWWLAKTTQWVTLSGKLSRRGRQKLTIHLTRGKALPIWTSKNGSWSLKLPAARAVGLVAIEGVNTQQLQVFFQAWDSPMAP